MSADLRSIRTILRMEDGFGEIRSTLQRASKAGLIHDLDDEGFADMFAQTVTYGLFSVSVRRIFSGEGTGWSRTTCRTSFSPASSSKKCSASSSVSRVRRHHHLGGNDRKG